MDAKYFTKVSYVIATILSFIILFSFVVAGTSTKNNALEWGALLCLPFPFIGVWLGSYLNDFIFEVAKGQITKKSVIFLSTLLFIIKYIIIVLPLLIGVLTNSLFGNEIFSIISLAVGTLVYPMIVLVVQFCFVGKWKRKEDSVTK